MVATVSVVLTGCVPSVTVAGLNVHVAPAGSPEQANVVAPLSPPDAVSVMVAEADCPRATVTVLGLALMLKSGVVGVAFTVVVVLAELFAGVASLGATLTEAFSVPTAPVPGRTTIVAVEFPAASDAIVQVTTLPAAPQFPPFTDAETNVTLAGTL